MKGLSKSMQSLDEHLRKQNRERSKEWAPLPPIPADPLRCRWCGGRRRAILSATDNAPEVIICPSGCADNDQHPYSHDCTDCHRQFTSGRKLEDQCFECNAKDQAAHVESHKSVGRSYDYRKFGRGRLRE